MAPLGYKVIEMEPEYDASKIFVKSLVRRMTKFVLIKVSIMKSLVILVVKI